jgi:hypothetical protein
MRTRTSFGTKFLTFWHNVHVSTTNRHIVINSQKQCGFWRSKENITVVNDPAACQNQVKMAALQTCFSSVNLQTTIPAVIPGSTPASAACQQLGTMNTSIIQVTGQCPGLMDQPYYTANSYSTCQISPLPLATTLAPVALPGPWLPPLPQQHHGGYQQHISGYQHYQPWLSGYQWLWG